MATISRICRKCGVDTPAEQLKKVKHCTDGVDSLCKQCQLAQSRAWAATHPERTRAIKKAYKERNREKVKQADAEYNQRHKETHADRRKRIYERDKPRELETAKQYRNSPKGRAIQRNAQARRRGLKMNAEGTFTLQDVQLQFKRQKGKCYWCGKFLGDKYHADHVIPLSRGGSNDASNIVVACPPCNQSKNDKLPHEWHGNGGKLL